jgi:hypothetical protein
LYLEGLAGGEFEPVFRVLVGETAALSPSSILKLKADWQQEYETWKKRPLRGRFVYLYAAAHERQQAAACAGERALPRFQVGAAAELELARLHLLYVN